MLAAATHSSIKLKWLAPSDNGAAILSYRLLMRVEGEEQFTVAYHGGSLTYKCPKLAAASSYFFKLQAINKVGSGEFSGEACLSTLAAGVPAAPTISGINKQADGVSSLCWCEPQSNGAAITSYTVEQ